MLPLYENINALVKTSKMEGLSTRVNFLSIIIDTNNITAGISPECRDLLLSILFLRKKNKCTKHQLLHLVRKSSFACKVGSLSPYQPYSCTISHINHHNLWLCIEAYLDLDWWLTFLPTWNGVSCILHGNKLVHFSTHGPVHQCIWHPCLSSILVRKLDSNLIVT